MWLRLKGLGDTGLLEDVLTRVEVPEPLQRALLETPSAAGWMPWAVPC